MCVWGSNNFLIFVKFKEGVDLEEFESGLGEFFDKYFDKFEIGKVFDFNKL